MAAIQYLECPYCQHHNSVNAIKCASCTKVIPDFAVIGTDISVELLRFVVIDHNDWQTRKLLIDLPNQSISYVGRDFTDPATGLRVFPDINLRPAASKGPSGVAISKRHAVIRLQGDSFTIERFRTTGEGVFTKDGEAITLGKLENGGFVEILTECPAGEAYLLQAGQIWLFGSPWSNTAPGLAVLVEAVTP